jgi:hypothetical protein
MEMTFSLCHHRPLFFPCSSSFTLVNAMCSNGTLIHFSNKNGRTSKERLRVLVTHSFHSSNE